MKKWISVLICAIMLGSLIVHSPVTAQDTELQTTPEPVIPPSPISDKLAKILSSSSDEKIPVMIRFRDDYDEAKVEEEALALSKNSESKKDLTAARNEVLTELVTAAREELIKSTGISKEDIESHCTLIPFISLAWLTPNQIKQLASHPDVLSIEYVDVQRSVETYTWTCN